MGTAALVERSGQAPREGKMTHAAGLARVEDGIHDANTAFLGVL